MIFWDEDKLRLLESRPQYYADKNIIKDLSKEAAEHIRKLQFIATAMACHLPHLTWMLDYLADTYDMGVVITYEEPYVKIGQEW